MNFYAYRQQYTEVATTGSRHTKWIVDSRAREPSKLYSAEHDQTQVDTIITVIFAIIEITHRDDEAWTPTRADSPVSLPTFATQDHHEDTKLFSKLERNCC